LTSILNIGIMDLAQQPEMEILTKCSW